MNKIKYSDKYIEWCKKFNQNPALIYLIQCSLILETDEALAILFESLRGDEYEMVTRVLLCEDEDGIYSLKKGLPWFWDEVVEKKEKGTPWKDLMKALGQISTQIESKYGYFFSPKGSLQDAKHTWEIGKYDFDKSVKTIIKFYENYSSDTINPPGLYTLLLSPSFEINYNNFKESKTAFDKYE